MTAVSTYRIVSSDQAFASALPALSAGARLAVDVESDGFHRYPEQVALIQVATESGEVLLLDPLSVEDIGRLADIFADEDVTKVLHAADFDVRSLRRDFGFQIRGLLDTAVAAQFVGTRRTGLANVLSDRLGVDLPKPKRLQRLDWSRRPLPDDALAYAASDVEHLLDLHDDLAGELRALGREAWVREESQRLEAVRFAAPTPPEVAFMQVPGARDLTPQGRAVLREVFVLREEVALAIGRPPHWLLPRASMLKLASDGVAALGDLGRVRPELRRHLPAAVRRGLDAPPVQWPMPPGRNPWHPAARRRLRQLKAWRMRAARRLGLDVGIVWPADHLKRVALAPTEDLAALDEDLGVVRRWQFSELGDSLRAAIRDMEHAPSAAPAP